MNETHSLRALSFNFPIPLNSVLPAHNYLSRAIFEKKLNAFPFPTMPIICPTQLKIPWYDIQPC